MTPETLPAKLLKLVSPQHVRSYALAKGWQRVPNVNGVVALFNHPSGDWQQLLVPMDSSLDDYSRRIRDVVQMLADYESRPAREILDELLLPEWDIVRYRNVSTSTRRGTVPLLDGLQLLDGAKKSLLAAACSVVNPVTHHARMSFAEAQALVNATHLGQTDLGSFTVTIACPLRAVDAHQPLLPSLAPSFTRDVTVLLMQSIDRLVSAIESDVVAQVYENKSSKIILSANLCDALLQMQPSEEESELVISVSWASTLPLSTNSNVPCAVRIRHEYFPIIEDVYKKLQPSKQPAESVFLGYVDTLNGDIGDDGQMQGETVLAVVFEEELVRARADLKPEDYRKAVDAHRVGQPVKFRGVLHRGRRIHRITDVREFQWMQQ